ncbi:inovirus Gp2 family protein [Proteus faecis]|uniref:inovirus Gp2 family protein n=1 Tax=Proteus faecis TaxID=2050967 RepID=UPI003075D4B6
MKINTHLTNQKTISINLEIKDKIIKTMGSVLEQSSRVFIVRIDLRFPLKVKHKKDSRVISRFFESLKSKLKAKEKRNKKDKKRIYPNKLKYVWVREVGPVNKHQHYHCVLFFNKDTFFSLGNFENTYNLYSMINSAWFSAIGINKVTSGLVHYVPFEIKYLNKKEPEFKEKKDKWINFLTYLAKDFSKPYKDGYRVVGCSQ